MSILRPGDEKVHYGDGSHRWIPPDPDYDQEVWDEQVRQHQHRHLRNERPKVRLQRPAWRQRSGPMSGGAHLVTYTP